MKSFIRRVIVAPHPMIVTIAIVALLLATPASRAAVESPFNQDLEGWTVTGDATASWSATGGLAGGGLVVNDAVLGDGSFAVAPVVYLGDWSAMTSSDSLILDIYFENTSGGTTAGTSLFRINGPGGAAHSSAIVLPISGAWTRFSIGLEPANWTLDTGSWADLTAQVTSLAIATEFVSGDEVVRLDNIRLTGDPSPVYVRCAAETFSGSGTGLWSFANTAGTDNPGGGGNSGGYCQISDALGATSYAFAPPQFHGDWSPLDGSGRLTIDLRLLEYESSGSSVDIGEFIRLSGPGGVAAIPMRAADLPPQGRLWKTYVFPLARSEWTLSAGTWEGLLANVTECRIQLEFINGTETVGFDNFARLAADCGEPDLPVTVHVPDAHLIDHLGLSGISTVACNPADGFLYGTVNATAAAGGGIYALEGAAAGTRLQGHDLVAPDNLIFDGAGNSYVSQHQPGTIYRRTPAGASALWVSGFHAGDDDPAGMCIAPAGFSGPNVAPGDILVTDFGYLGPDEVWAFSPLVAESERRVMADPGEVDFFDITAGPSGVVYLADALNASALSILSPTGDVAPLALDSPLPGLGAIAYDQLGGRIYVGQAQSLSRVDPASGVVETVASGFARIERCGIEIDAISHRLWVADAGAGRVYCFGLGMASAVGDDLGSDSTRRGSQAELRVWPNPSSTSASISLSLARDAVGRLELFDLSGRLVRILESGHLSRGERQLRWDGRDMIGHQVASGMYFIRLTTNEETVGRAVLLLR